MKGIQKLSKRLIVLALILAALSAGAWRGWSWWRWAIGAPATATDVSTLKPIKLNIPHGSSAQEIGQDLYALGLIRSTTAWNLWTRWLTLRDPKGGFQAGIYQFSPTEPLDAIATKIWQGQVLNLTFTIPEGWSTRQMGAYFEQQGFFSAQDFLKAVEQVSRKEYPWLPDVPPGTSRLEGYLYPDTYQVALGGTTPDVILKQMLDRFAEVALPLYEQNRDKTELSFAEWVTLASIVEKEAVIASERPLIAGVFANRLKQGMPLGADPTVEYGLGIQQTPDQPLTFAQVETPSPYNTYLNAGLPPTPISSPGVESLKAALSPQSTDYLYFVARYDGTHVFSRTLAEHQSAQSTIHDQREDSKSRKD